MDPATLNAKAIELSKLALRMTTKAGAGHPSSAVSLAHIITVLMYQEMSFDPQDPWHAAADRLILSEGHAVPIVYAAYADLGGVVGRTRAAAKPLAIADLDQLRELSSVLDGHPNPAEGLPFFDAATGSLGMGLSVAAGLALAARVLGVERDIYCVVGDGESREGQVAEALDFIIDHRLNSICAVFNCNGEGQAGAVSQQQSPEVLERKARAFGWATAVIDGHDPAQISQACRTFRASDAPLAVIARTVKGWGVAALREGNFHGKPLPEDQLPAAYASLDEMHARADTTPGMAATFPAPTIDRPDIQRSAAPIALPAFEEGLEASGFGRALSRQSLATRRAYGAALSALGKADPRVVALDGDVSNSTFSEVFAAHHPERFFECKIAEQNMVSAAVGLAAAGLIPFVNSFGKFLVRAYDQIELAAITRANIKLVGSHSGLGPASDGPSQMSLADLGFFRAYCQADDGTGTPSCVLLHPADAIAAYKLTEVMANHHGLCYMRTHRPDVPFIYSAGEGFEAGGCKILREGRDITVVASGYTVGLALAACEQLARDGVRATLVDAYTLPLDAQPLLECAARTGARILTIEENYAGGMGAAVAEAAALAGRFTVKQLRVTAIPKSAREPETLMQHFGLSAQDLCRVVGQYVSSSS